MIDEVMYFADLEDNMRGTIGRLISELDAEATNRIYFDSREVEEAIHYFYKRPKQTPSKLTTLLDVARFLNRVQANRDWLGCEAYPVLCQIVNKIKS